MTRMDCETFDLDVVDLLYEDGDDDAHEALALHAASCARCGATLASLRAAREQAAKLPRVAPPGGLAARIVAAEAAARRPAPLSRRVARAASWAGSFAMRPQLAMAALFCLAVGSSLLLLRARSNSVPGPTSVREAGLPTPAEVTPHPEGVAGPTLAPAPAARALQRGDAADRGDEERGGEAKRRPADDAPAAEPTPAASAAGDAKPGEDADRALTSALARLRDGGCDAATGELEAIVRGFAETPASARAAHELAACRPSASASGPAAKPAAAPPATAPAAGGSPNGARPPAKGDPAPDDHP